MWYLISLLSISATIVTTLTVATVSSMRNPEPQKTEDTSKVFWEGGF